MAFEPKDADEAYSRFVRQWALGKSYQRKQPYAAAKYVALRDGFVVAQGRTRAQVIQQLRRRKIPVGKVEIRRATFRYILPVAASVRPA